MDKMAFSSANIDELTEAVRKGDFEAVNGFIDRHGVAAINAHDSDGLTALMWSAMRGDTDMANLLLSKGADIEKCGADMQHFAADTGETALMKAAVFGKADMVAFLLEAGASVERQDDNARSALVWTVLGGIQKCGRVWMNEKELWQGCCDIAWSLLKAEALLETVDGNRSAALKAAESRRIAGMDQLIDLLKKDPKAELEKQHAEWKEATNCKKGLKRAIPAPKLIII
jgi:hypothetical protein